MIVLQRLEELLHIVLGAVPVDAELPDDLIYDFGLARPSFEKLEDSRSGQVEVEHLALPDIKNDGAVLAVGAAHRAGHSVHLKSHLLDVWAHCDTLRCLKTRKK
jgi:hypothetical protein